MVFVVKIKDGTMVEGSGHVSRHIKSCADGYYSLELKKGSKRSLLQNAYYRAIMQIVGDDLGYSKDEMSNIFKSMFLKKERFDERLGSIEIIESTASLTTNEFVEYMDQITRRCGENGIAVPEPQI